MDSMQVYRGMDIGTAKPTAEERSLVVHHLVDVADPAEDYSVVRFQREARAAIADIEERGRRALLVGGTGLYLQAVIDDLTFPGEDRELRAALEERAAGPAELADMYAELTVRDPVAAARIEPGNRRRVVRALEVIELTGRPFSSFGAGIATDHTPVIPVRIAGLAVEVSETSRRIEARVAAMAAAGLLDEVLGLRARPWSRTARQAIGYKEVLEFLDGRLETFADACVAIARRSRTFARRQRAWFRRDGRIRWFDATTKSAPAVSEVVAWWTGS